MKSHVKYAGNFGDVLKHAILPELVSNMAGNYVETHAGWHHYDRTDLTDDDGNLTHGRPWGLGYLMRMRSLELTALISGKMLASYRTTGTYHGSIARIVDARLRGYNKFWWFTGFDLNPEVVQQYAKLGDPRINVSLGDGYKGYKSIKNRTVVFCDPFWGDDENVDAIHELITAESSILWYPLIDKSAETRELIYRDHQIGYIEMSFVDPEWQGEGYGMAFRDVQFLATDRAINAARTLLELYGLCDILGRATNLKMSCKMPK